MLELSNHPAVLDGPDEGSLAETLGAESVDRVQGDPELAAMLDVIRSLLNVESVALRLIGSDDEIGTLLAAVGPDIAPGAMTALPQTASASAGSSGIGGLWLPGGASGRPVHASILQPRARDRIALLCLPAHGAVADRRLFERHLMLYLPLIERSIAQWAQAHVERLRRREEHAVFDTLGFGLLIVDIDCRIHLANMAAGVILGGPGALSDKDGHLAILHVEDAMRFQVSLRHVLGHPHSAGKPMVVTVSRRGDLPLLLTLRALPVVANGPALATVEIIDPRVMRELPLEPLARHFDFTQSERRLVEQLVRGKTLGEAAAAMRLKEQTARTYLKQIFQKTGLRRQVELISMVLAGSMPGLAAA